MKLKHLLIIPALVIMSGCASQRAAKELSAFHQYASNHPGELAKDCALYFPAQDVLLKGDTVVKHDSTVVNVAVPCPPSTDGKTVYVNVPQKVITITKSIHDTLKVVDKAEVRVLNDFVTAKNDSIQVYKTNLINMTGTRDSWRKWCLILGAILLALTAFNVMKLWGKVAAI